MNLFLLCLVAVFSSVVSGVIGLAGGTILISFMTFFLPVQSIVPIHGCIQLASNSSRAFFLKGNVNKKIISYFLPGLILGAITSRFILQFITSPDTFYYFLVGDLFCCGWDQRQIVEALPFTPELNLEFATYALYMEWFPKEQSFLKEISRLPAATTLVVDASANKKLFEYWKFEPNSVTQKKSDEDFAKVW